MNILRYPGGKQRFEHFLLRYIPTRDAIKGKFIVIGRLRYYYSFYQHPPIRSKINELIALIKEYFPNIDHILEDIRDLCNHNQLKSKDYKKLVGLFNKIDKDIKELK